MTFKKAGLVLVWIDRRILCLHSTARYWANLLYKLPSLTRGKNNTMFHQPQDPQGWRMWDLVTQLVYNKRGRASYNHKSMTQDRDYTNIDSPSSITRKQSRRQPKLNSLHLNPTTSPNHRPATESCCQWDTEQDTRTSIWGICYFGTSPWWLWVCLHQSLLKLLEKKPITTRLINGLRWEAAGKRKSIPNNNC